MNWTIINVWNHFFGFEFSCNVPRVYIKISVSWTLRHWILLLIYDISFWCFCGFEEGRQHARSTQNGAIMQWVGLVDIIVGLVCCRFHQHERTANRSARKTIKGVNTGVLSCCQLSHTPTRQHEKTTNITTITTNYAPMRQCRHVLPLCCSGGVNCRY